MKRIAILQPNYLPWKGVFDLANRVDAFVFLDDVQYTTKDWRNRNRIKGPNGEIWLTVPVVSKNLREQLICDAKIDNSSSWQIKHARAIEHSYAKAPFFDDFRDFIQSIYFENEWANLADLNIQTTMALAKRLGIEVNWFRASDLGQDGQKTGEKIIKICKLLACDHFINGPSSREFMNQDLFDMNNITLEYIEYKYPIYPQLHGEFNHQVSVLDVLFSMGPEAKKVIFDRPRNLW